MILFLPPYTSVLFTSPTLLETGAGEGMYSFLVSHSAYCTPAESCLAHLDLEILSCSWWKMHSYISTKDVG